ncbi:MAG: choice-of-anchor D domain-containing protein [Ferruginibacter sp.]
MKRHLFILWVLIGVFTSSISAQVAQFPQVYYNGQGAGGTNLNIRSVASLTSGTVLTTLATSSRIGAETFTTSTETNGTATWIKVCLPNTTGSITYGYMLYGEYYARIYQNNNYATTTANLNIRTGAGTTFPNVTIGGTAATFGNNSTIALTGTSTVVSGTTWYQVYLTNNCSQTTGYVSGAFLNIPSSQNYYIVAGTVQNPSSVSIWGATVTMGSWTTNSTEGFYQYKLPVNWTGLITCSHPNYNTSNPTSYNHTANGHIYNRNFILSNSSSPAINLSGNLAFGNVTVGTTSQRTLTITNTGNATLNVTSINYPTGFSGNWNSGSIAAGGSQNVTVTFAPTAATTYGGTITVNSNATSGTNTISCSGTGTTTASTSISLSGNLAFGYVTVGTTSQRTLTITNTGNATLNVTSINYPTGFSGNWNSGSIAAGGSQNVTVTFAPTAATTYGGTITVNSNATSGTNTISCSGTGATIASPSSITISNVIRNNSTFPNPKILWTGNTNQTPATIKICADGSTATKISFTNNTGISSSNIKFWINSDPFGNNSDLSGYFINYSINGNIITAELAHPKYLPSNYRPFKSDQIRIVDFNSPNQTIFSLPLEIYRAPVLMVHGLWGAYSTFENVDNYLKNNNYYLPSLTVRANYEPTNDFFLYDNRFVVPTDINTLLTRARNNNISAGKVDVIAHSMGGLIARYYLQSTGYSQKQDIHKLITINTPHSGAPIANLLTNTTSVTADAARIVAEPLANQIFNGSIYNGAISDLSINSNALMYLNSSTLNNGVVPSHAIITTSQVINDNFWHLVFAAAAPTLSMTINDFVSYLFYNQSNDLVVATTSQSGGLPISARTTYPNIFHNGSYNNSFVLNEIVSALNINSSNTNYFAQNGFAPEVIQSHYRPVAPTEFNRIVSSVKINSPIQNQNFNAGSIVPVDITTNNGVNRIVLEGITRINNSNFVDTLLSNGIISYKIPNDAIGKLKFIAIGYNSNNLIDYDTVTININQSSTLDSITFHSDTLFVQVNNTVSIPLTAYFSSGASIDINALTGVQFQVTDTTFAKYITHSTIQGKEVGITKLNATYQGKIKQIPISVIPEDTTIKKGFINNNGVSPNPVSQLIPTDSIKVYPNPNKGSFTAFMVLREDEEFQIDVFNQNGQLIYSTKRKSINKILRASISIGSTIANGVYYIKAIGATKSYTGRFIVLPDK